MNNIQKNFKKRSALRHMADGGSLLDSARTKVGDMIANHTGRGQYDPNPGMVATPAAAPAPERFEPLPLPSGMDSTADTMLNTRARQMRALGLRDGGKVRGPGGPTDDKVGPVMLSDEEYVLPADTVAAIGKDKLDAIRMATHDFVDEDQKPKGLRGLADGGQRVPVLYDPVQAAALERAKQAQFADRAASGLQPRGFMGPEAPAPAPTVAPAPQAAAPAGDPRAPAPRITALRAPTTPGNVPVIERAMTAGRGLATAGVDKVGQVLGAPGRALGRAGSAVMTGAKVLGAAAPAIGAGEAVLESLDAANPAGDRNQFNEGLSKLTGANMDNAWVRAGGDTLRSVGNAGNAMAFGLPRMAANKIGDMMSPDYDPNAGAKLDPKFAAKGAPTTDLSPYQQSKLRQAGVTDPTQAAMLGGDWRKEAGVKAVNELGTKDFQRLPGNGEAGAPIFGRVNEATKRDNTGMLVTDKKMNDFVGVGAPRTEAERMAEGRIAADRNTNALRIYGEMGSTGGSAPPVNSGRQEINERFDALARDAGSRFTSAKAGGNLNAALMDIEKARAQALGNDQQSMVAQRGQDQTATTARISALRSGAGKEGDAQKAQIDALKAQIELNKEARAQDDYTQDKQVKGQERILKQAQGMFRTTDENGKSVTDEGAAQAFSSFLSTGGVKDPDTGKSFLELRPEEQEAKLPMFKKQFEMMQANDAEAAKAGAATTGGVFAAPRAERDATISDWWNDQLSAGSYLRAKGQGLNPFTESSGKVIDNGTNLSLSSDALVDENGNLDAAKVRLLRQYTGR